MQKTQEKISFDKEEMRKILNKTPEYNLDDKFLEDIILMIEAFKLSTNKNEIWVKKFSKSSSFKIFISHNFYIKLLNKNNNYELIESSIANEAYNKTYGVAKLISKINNKKTYISKVSLEDYINTDDPKWSEIPETCIKRAAEAEVIRLARPFIHAIFMIKTFTEYEENIAKHDKDDNEDFAQIFKDYHANIKSNKQ